MKLNECGWHSQTHDTYICQVCGNVFCSGCHEASWRTDITKNKHAGNVCPECEKTADTIELDVFIKK